MSDQATATVRFFAALRDAAGTSQCDVGAPVQLPVMLADLTERFGERFAARVQIAAVMVDGTPVDRNGDILIPAGAEVALLPPFAGGSALGPAIHTVTTPLWPG